MKRINLIFGCHSHQPVGNFDFVFERAYEQAYEPFISVLEQYPAVRVTLHYTGPLWDWFSEHRPAFIERLGRLVRAGQVEIMGGGYYEPLLCAVPERDAIAQIARMQVFCERHFGVRPRGMWLAERVWEPGMARTLVKAGIEYSALDDSHFLCSGLQPEALFGYYMTEDEGYALKVFPILERLRYLIPFHQVSESIAFLRDHASEDGARCAVIHDDGEKFGVWPGTHHSVYEEGWLEEFFDALTQNQDWIQCLTYAEYMAKAAPSGRVYLPCASYQEMMEWALPTPMQRRLHALHEELKSDSQKAARYGPFVRGGFWRSFLAKYPEANNLQKRMLRVSKRLARLKQEHPGAEHLLIAEERLHKGQCNCAYWHGVFGGLYLNHLRSAVYEQLIAADHALDALERPEAGWVSCTQTDFDGDGNEEAILENESLCLFFSPVDGGTLFELDYKPSAFNFCNTLTRREEAYHEALRSGRVHVGEEATGDLSIHELVKAKEANLDAYLLYDSYRRVSLRDHFLSADVTAETLWQGTYQELGDFTTGVYEVSTAPNAVTLSRTGCLGADMACPIRLVKRVMLAPGASAFEIRYDIECRGNGPVDVLFAVEFAVNLLTGAAPDRYYRSDDRDLKRIMLGQRGCAGELAHIALRDDWQGLECGFRFSRAARVYHFAIETVSQSENGQERVHQGCVVLPCWTVRCTAGKRFTYEIRVEIIDTKNAGRGK